MHFTNLNGRCRIIIARQYLKGFTLIELLVVVAIIAILLSIVLPSLRKAKMYARRVICSNQVRQLAIGCDIYSQLNDNLYPLNAATGWLWDISYKTTDFLINHTGMVRPGFYCPGDATKKPDDDRFWRWTESNPDVPRVPEPTDSTARRNNYRVTSYFYLLDTEPGRGSIYTARRGNAPTGPTRLWPRKKTDIHNTGSWELVTDASISVGTGGRNDQFIDIHGGSWAKWQIPDNTNHIDSRNRPLGTNVGFADGHVDWRPFNQMNVWGQFGPYHWW